MIYETVRQLIFNICNKLRYLLSCAVGDLDLQVLVRDCFPSVTVGCQGKGVIKDEVIRVVNTALWLATAGLNFQLSSLEYCSCDLDLCDPKCTPSDGLHFLGTWYVTLVC